MMRAMSARSPVRIFNRDDHPLTCKGDAVLNCIPPNVKNRCVAYKDIFEVVRGCSNGAAIAA